MISERLLNVITGALLFLIMGVVAWQLSEGWRPDRIYSRAPSAYTESYVEELILEKIYYEKNFKELEGILGQ